VRRAIRIGAALWLAGAAVGFAAASGKHVPTVDDLLNLQSVGGAQISPDGTRVAYTVSAANFKEDAFVSQIWVANAATGETLQITRGEKSSTSPRWSPDGQWVAFLSNRVKDKNQIFAIRLAGGEAAQLTKSETAISSIWWSPDGKTIAFAAPEPDAQARKDRKEHLAEYEVVRGDYAFAQLFTLDVAEALKAPVKGKQRTKGTDRSVSSFSWSPDGARIVFAATKNPDLIQGVTSDIYVVKLSDDSVAPLVSQPGPDTNPKWSPDGKEIVFQSAMGNTRYFASNTRLAVVPAQGGSVRSLTPDFDEDPFLIDWIGDGVYFAASRKTAAHLFRLDPATGRIAAVSAPDGFMGNGFSFSKDGKRVAFTAGSPTSVPELFVSDLSPFNPRALTKMTDQAKDLTLGTREVISWQSQDGATIEGVLIKPADFDPKKKHALLCVIHGGPTGVDRPVLLQPDSRYYPSDIWAARGALILKVNYRGSAGYGEKFRKLNERNLGVGDAWDVLSGVDYLVGKGWVDPTRVGCMGWSQGGYISAFLTTSTTRFKAISDGAGISNWATYYYNTDITPFTINYLGTDPVEDPEIYRKTSPISYVKGAKTPTLIQHGENDKRVPIANAYELRQALEDRGVPVEMVVYKGFGHGINKPKAMRAVMTHNLAWFNHYIFGDPKPDLAHPDVPKKDSKDKDDKEKDEEKKAE
jgi:dipeptidyl aminopeptidase/acylaminoacyl peptidase